MIDFDPVAYLGFFFLVLLLIISLAWFIKNKTPLAASAADLAPEIKVLSTRRLDAKSRLCVIGYDQKKLLIGVTPYSITLLETSALSPKEAMTADGAKTTNFVSFLDQVRSSS